MRKHFHISLRWACVDDTVAYFEHYWHAGLTSLSRRTRHQYSTLSRRYHYFSFLLKFLAAQRTTYWFGREITTIFCDIVHDYESLMIY